MRHRFDTPVVVVLFNRPDRLEELLAVLREIRRPVRSLGGELMERRGGRARRAGGRTGGDPLQTPSRSGEGGDQRTPQGTAAYRSSDSHATAKVTADSA